MYLNHKFKFLHEHEVSNPLHKSRQPYHWGSNWPCPSGILAPIDLSWEQL